MRNCIQQLRHGSPKCDPTYLQSLPAPLGAIGHSLAPGLIGLMSPAHREAHAAGGSCVQAHPRSTQPLRHGVPRVIQPTCKAPRPPSVRLDTRLRRGLSALRPRPTVRRTARALVTTHSG